MAGLKKNKRQKDTGSPNLVLVLFLVVFVLSNIIFGLLLYFSYQDLNTALATKTAKEREKVAAEKAIDVYKTVLNDMRTAMGQELTQDEMTLLDANRKQFL